jgi:hypothetical protein
MLPLESNKKLLYSSFSDTLKKFLHVHANVPPNKSSIIIVKVMFVYLNLGRKFTVQTSNFGCLFG